MLLIKLPDKQGSMREDRRNPCGRHYPGTIIQELTEGTQENVKSDKRTGLFREALAALLLELFSPIPNNRGLATGNKGTSYTGTSNWEQGKDQLPTSL
ncbi:unnamed protein product, partial [Cochlearia groenlandica]